MTSEVTKKNMLRFLKLNGRSDVENMEVFFGADDGRLSDVLMTLYRAGEVTITGDGYDLK